MSLNLLDRLEYALPFSGQIKVKIVFGTWMLFHKDTMFGYLDEDGMYLLKDVFKCNLTCVCNGTSLDKYIKIDDECVDNVFFFKKIENILNHKVTSKEKKDKNVSGQLKKMLIEAGLHDKFKSKKLSSIETFVVLNNNKKNILSFSYLWKLISYEKNINAFFLTKEEKHDALLRLKESPAATKIPGFKPVIERKINELNNE